MNTLIQIQDIRNEKNHNNEYHFLAIYRKEREKGGGGGTAHTEIDKSTMLR